MALSITATRSSSYLDGEPAKVDAATWVLPYSAHRGGDGEGANSRWNRALLANWVRKIPVGVFVQAKKSYLNLGLAVVEDYEPRTDTFLLRGPLRHEQPAGTWEGLAYGPSRVEETDFDEPVAALIRQRRGQSEFRDRLVSAYAGKCVATGYNVADALQAAHILAYSGRSSQSSANGILLRADVHLLFDRYLLGVHPETRSIKLAPSLLATAYGHLQGRQLREPEDPRDRPSEEKLAVHWAVFEGSAA